MLTKIYRIENPFGGGMYQSDRRVGSNFGEYNKRAMTGIDLVGVNHMGIERLSGENKAPEKGPDYRPAPRSDGIILKGTRSQKYQWYHGFKDLNQLLTWFENKVTVKDILDLGLRIKILYVTKVIHGHRQVVYHKKSIRREFCIVNGELRKMYMQQEVADMALQKANDQIRKEQAEQYRTRKILDAAKLLDLPPSPIVLDDSDTFKWGTPTIPNLMTTRNWYSQPAAKRVVGTVMPDEDIASFKGIVECTKPKDPDEWAIALPPIFQRAKFRPMGNMNYFDPMGNMNFFDIGVKGDNNAGAAY